MADVLVIDDDDSIRETLKILLSEMGHRVSLAPNGQAGVQMIEEETPNLVICDLKMPGMSGLQVLDRIKELDSHIQTILITAYGDINSTIQAMQKGVFDYLHKPLEIGQLKMKVNKALENQNINKRLADYITEDSAEYQLENSIIGNTAEMREIYKYIGQLSMNKVSVLIQGESGTGKELISKVIHYSGVTKEQPFIAVNCTVLTDSLLESELFGHVRGAFTGAIRDKKGKFELAEEGTIFLDEISEMSANLQVKLLRVLQEREFEKVGGETLIPMRARIIAATNKSLAELVEMGKFREDLYYRLKVFTINIPPLRERKKDIPLLVMHLLKKINKELHKNVRKVPYSVMEMLQNYDWVGNVRELENTLIQAVVLSKGDVLEKENILLRENAFSDHHDDSDLLSLADVEKKHIKHVLDRVEWDKSRACEILGISKPTLYHKIDAYQLGK
ncbi:MAG: sigma-54 dependent transcriptional regulator [Bacteroidota bacterium]|nr:sigma-54 dependent transcriptional regulator [Bacteroidota bacterium]MDP4197370.1 sigma-54 dependent transcriptional regulator [Bacteroidota bacterium]